MSGVSIADPDGGNGNDDLSVVAEIALSRRGADGSGREGELCSPRLGADGRLRFAVESSGPLVPTGDCDVDVELLDASVDPEGTVTATIRATPRDRVPADRRDASRPAELEPGVTEEDDDCDPAADEGTPVAEGDPDARDSEVPPFKDPDLLADVYESCDTFAQMADAIDMDVTAETVRRYMIDYDIHQPNSYRTAADDDGSADETEAGESDGSDAGVDPEHAEPHESGQSIEDDDGRAAVEDTAEGTAPSAATAVESTEPVVLSDGIGLPDDVTVDTLIDTVKRSNTLYEVTREINVDRQDALDVLEELNLLDLVVGRLATEGQRDLSREEIVDRLRAAPGTQ